VDPYLDSSDPEFFELTEFAPDLFGSKPVHRPLVLVLGFNIYASFLAVCMWPFPFFEGIFFVLTVFFLEWWLAIHSSSTSQKKKISSQLTAKGGQSCH
jgi:hypothetical protein